MSGVNGIISTMSNKFKLNMQAAAAATSAARLGTAL